MLFLLLVFAFAKAETLTIGKLSSEYCEDAKADLFTDQRYWFPRVPPYVGYAKGEQTSAGGDGTCYLGFPKAKSKAAVIMLNGEIIKVSPNKQGSTFKSADGNIEVQIKITGFESTCEPDADKCCGDYTYATITVIRGKIKASVKAAQYSGG